jgi:cytoskeleton-associated protein 5
LSDIVPDVLPSLASKNPQVKEGTLKFLSRCLSNATTPLPLPQLRTIADPLASLLEDSFEGARNEAASCLGTLMKMVGERPLNALMEPLAEVRKAKVKEAFEKANVKCKSGAGVPSKPAVAAKEPPKRKTPPVKNDISANNDTVGDGNTLPKKPSAKPPAKPAVRNV